jgi:peptide-methionine (S)-S-oxide reductase
LKDARTRGGISHPNIPIHVGYRRMKMKIAAKAPLKPSGEIARNAYGLVLVKILLLPVLALALLTSGAFAESKPMNEQPKPSSTQQITFGGGCFWCLEAVFQRLVGVKSVASGYAGGNVPNPTYKQVCTGDTGHAEVVQIEFDPAQISFEKLLEVFWAAHDPTTLNRQGADFGTQYRSIILYANEEQKAAAEKSKQAAQAEFKSPIVTQIVPLKTFYKAEDYHQNYYNENAAKNPYCSVVIQPKLQKLLHKGLIKE